MLTTSLTLNKEKWKPIWNKALVFLCHVFSGWYYAL